MRVRGAWMLCVVVGCGDPEPLPPRAQILLYIDTDAVLPPPEGAPPEPPLSPQPLFDRMTIEVFGPGAEAPCEGCRREFGIDREMLARVEASIGVVPETTDPGYRARVRMFRAASVRAGVLSPDVTLESTVALPAVGDEGIVEVHVRLFTQNVGIPVGGLATPIAAQPGRPTASAVGSWPPAQRTTCPTEPEAGEVCIPGGAYWMGEVDLVGAVYDGDRERLVAIAPFFLDAAEVTVAQARAAGTSALPWSGTLDGDANDDWCTYTVEPGAREALALNCVSWGAARTHCQARGADLPSEAQWEYVARGLRGLRYPWGLEPPACGEAVWGHGFPPLLPACPVPNGIGGPLAPGSGPLDRLALPGGDVVDLAANLREWTRDVWNTQDEPCWTAPMSTDPICETAGAVGALARSVRGDGYFQPAILASAAGRNYETALIQIPLNGFRCARQP